MLVLQSFSVEYLFLNYHFQEFQSQSQSDSIPQSSQIMTQYQQNSATINSLQNYITELTVYINQNNAKYSKNLQTLKTFYQSQVQDLTQKNAANEQEKLQLKNQVITLKDVLNNRQKQIKDLKYKNAEISHQSQQNRQKLNLQRKKIDQLYQEIQKTKKSFNQELDNQQKSIKQIENQKNDLILKLKENQQQISSLKKQIFRLEDQLSQRYSLPEKLKDIEIQSAKNKTLVAVLSQTKKQLEKKLDYQLAETQRIKNQNKKLQINHDTRLANTKNQIVDAVTKQRQKAQQKQKRLQSTNQKQLFEINQLQNTLKMLKRQNSQLQRKLSQFVQQNKILTQRASNYDNQKQKYITEWRKLKYQYQQVIKSLQQTIPHYQKKIFDLSQQNNDLNIQLDGLRDLLNQIKSMNSLQPLKHQYRQIAQLQLLAQKDYQIYKNQEKQKDYQHNVKHNYKQEESFKKDQNQFNWDKLLADIQNIQVA